MDNQQKRKLTFLTIGLIFMLSGIEYAVILPTIWRYLQILEAPPYFLGLGLSAFSLSGLLTGPLFGLWSDRNKTTKTIILSPIYLRSSCWCGSGLLRLQFPDSEHAAGRACRIFAAIMACRQAGLLWIFMCLLWVLLQFVVLAMYWDVPPLSSEADTVMLEIKREENDEEEVPLMGSDDEPVHTYRAVNSDQSDASASSDMQPVHGPLSAPNPFKNFSASREFLREEVVVLLTAQFITLFNQTALETMVTPLTQRHFSFGELGNSLMYGLCGVEVILGFFFVRWLSRRVEDRAVLGMGLIICCTACIWCLVFLCDPRGGYEWELTAFIIGVFLQLLGLPFVAVSQVSLFSKVTAEKTQGFSQGVRRSVGGLATILGPLWAGGLTNNLYVMLGMMLALLIMITVMTVLSYDRLTEPRAVQSAQSCDSGG
ncbi:hypothetical protein F7725_011924 [Dissostichus mawsoni]|uniref:Major facilitator superfamily (MFS) profile domain-containing protein n=1 Tax=Dissostichus mawsoni TaxID=36200 RepID=A0A7J5ZAZ3_DISMA|nr:hypothetical protein F7725_011924 [Dissostichus mawsoni]